MRKSARDKSRDNKWKNKLRETDCKRRNKRVVLRKRNSETSNRDRRRQSISQVFVPITVTVGLSSNLSPSLHTHPPSCHYIVQANLDKAGNEAERESESANRE